MKEKAVLINVFLFIITLILIIFKIFFSLITRSIALQADAIDNVTDLVMIIASLVGVIFANKKPNERFPLGYYKLENIISLVISIFIFFTAFNIIQESSIDIYKFFIGIEKKIIVSNEVLIFLLISRKIADYKFRGKRKIL
jgi:cation diffusion facilitator family transporter